MIRPKEMESSTMIAIPRRKKSGKTSVLSRYTNRVRTSHQSLANKRLYTLPVDTIVKNSSWFASKRNETIYLTSFGLFFFGPFIDFIKVFFPSIEHVKRIWYIFGVTQMYHHFIHPNNIYMLPIACWIVGMYELSFIQKIATHFPEQRMIKIPPLFILQSLDSLCAIGFMIFVNGIAHECTVYPILVYFLLTRFISRPTSYNFCGGIFSVMMVICVLIGVATWGQKRQDFPSQVLVIHAIANVFNFHEPTYEDHLFLYLIRQPFICFHRRIRNWGKSIVDAVFGFSLLMYIVLQYK